MASTKVKKSNLDSSVFTDLTIIGNISATGNFYNNGGLVSGGGVDTELRSLTGSFLTSSSLASLNSVVTISSVDVTNNLTVTGPGRFNGDVTVFGNLSATGTSYFANTVYTTTSALSVVNLGNTGPAFYVGNNGTGDIASFYDLDQNVEVLHVGGNNGSFPNVGIKTSQPNKDLTVKGELSASGLIYSNGRALKPLSGVGGIVVNDSLTNVTVISADSSASAGTAKAWVNFDGTTSPGTIRSSYNVSSVTKNGTGDYTVNFATPMSNANYSVVGSCGNLLGVISTPYTSSSTINSTRVSTGWGVVISFGGDQRNHALYDYATVNIQIFGN